MNFLHRCTYLFIAIAILSGCQTSQTAYQKNAVPADSLLLEQAFLHHKSIVVETEAQIFALDDEMKQMVATELNTERDPHNKSLKLLEHIFSADNVGLAYQSGANVIASKAYHNQAANCLSLTIMAYALAKEAGLRVVFQDVKIPEYWVRNGHLSMLTGHVNLKVYQPKEPNKFLFLGGEGVEIDFNPFVVKKSFPKRFIERHTVLAMFYNNKGANALVDGEYNRAYAYLKAAISADATFAPAWGNLGILYRFTHHHQYAIKSYQQAIALDKSNYTAMSNLSMLLHKKGQLAQARILDAILIRARANNPYYYTLLGDEKYFEGRYQEALRHFQKAIRLDKTIHESYFGLAKVYYALKDYSKAQSFMKKAIAKSRVDVIDQRYIAKLNLLQQGLEFN